MDEEEGKGHVKITIDVEINDDMMEVLEESLQEVPKKVAEKLKKE